MLGKTIEYEISLINKIKVWSLVDRLTIRIGKAKPNVIDSRWELRKKVLTNNEIKYKARLVIHDFRDKINYGLNETYAPVSRMQVTGIVLTITNKYDLEARQLDVQTKLLNDKLDH